MGTSMMKYIIFQFAAIKNPPPLIVVFFHLAQLLVWNPAAGLHLFELLPLHRPPQSATLSQEAQAHSHLLRGGLDPLAGPVFS